MWQRRHARRIGGWTSTYPTARMAVLTFTAPAIVEDVERWNATAAHRFNRLMRDLRREGVSGDRGEPAGSAGAAAPPVEYVRVAEMQARGLIHYHVMAVEWGWVDIERLRLLAIRHGFGPRLELKRPRSAYGVAGYFVKWYLAKGGLPLPTGTRAIVYSKGWPRLWQPPSEDPVDAVVKVWREPDGREVSESWGEWADARIGAGYGTRVGSFTTGWPPGWFSGPRIATGVDPGGSVSRSSLALGGAQGDGGGAPAAGWTGDLRVPASVMAAGV